MSKEFCPLSLDLIDEGRFMEQAGKDLAELQAYLSTYCQEHGDKAKGGRAKLTIEVTLVCEDPEQDLFSIKALVRKTLPSRPPSVTAAIGNENQLGEQCLFVRTSGSTEDNPRQSILCTKDGRAVEQSE